MTSTFEPIASASNGAVRQIEMTRPYRASVTIEGTATILFHAWNCESVAEKGRAAKGSRAKKTDDVESYIYRDAAGHLGLPGCYLSGALVGAAKFVQDPRSPRKSACDLVKAAIVALDECATFEGDLKTWDFIDRRRVTVQRNALTRERPALRPGWRITFQLMILLPEYVSVPFLRKLIVDAGRLIGIADFRPTFGRFDMVAFDVEELPE